MCIIRTFLHPKTFSTVTWSKSVDLEKGPVFQKKKKNMYGDFRRVQNNGHDVHFIVIFARSIEIIVIRQSDCECFPTCGIVLHTVSKISKG